MRILMSLVLSLSLVPLASAQTVLSVPLDQARIVWDAPVLAPTTSPVTHYLVTCGTYTATTPDATPELLLSVVLTAPGTYTCTVQAVNQYGASVPSDPSPTFSAGYRPGRVPSIRLEVR